MSQMRRVGVILCSQTKKDYACEVREMYSDSISFEARKLFMDLAYDEWYVNTTSMGFMEPSLHIEPYESFYIRDVSRDNKWKRESKVVSREMLEEWREGLRLTFTNSNDFELHCHLSKPYYDELKQIFPNTRYIKPQYNQTSTAWMYYDATKMYLEGKSLDECLDFLNTTYTTNRPKEQPKWFYHPTGDRFFGTGNELSKTHNIDNGGAYGLSMGTYRMLGGWVTNENMLKYFYQTPNGQWRLTRDCPYRGNGDTRQGLPQKIKELKKQLGK